MIIDKICSLFYIKNYIQFVHGTSFFIKINKENKLNILRIKKVI